MSATFSAAYVKHIATEAPCDFTGCIEGDRCGYCRDGIMDEYKPTGPTVNFHNAGAALICRLLGLDFEAYEAPAEVIGTLRQRVLLARNSESRRIPEIIPSTQDGRVFSFGVDEEGILRRLDAIDEILADAQAHNCGIRWD
jgi:hypothetical protein